MQPASEYRPSTLVIVNPVSGGGRTARRWPRLRDALYARGLHYDVHLTSAVGDATLTVRRALQADYQRIVVVGGDGTLNEAVNGFFADRGGAVNSDATLGLLSCGTGGDFRRTLDLPRRFEALAEVLARGNSRTVDIGLVTFDDPATRPRYFINVADCGLGGEVAAHVNRSNAKAPGVRGTAVFLGTALAALATYGGRAVRVSADGEVLESHVHNVVVANGRYFGGGMHIAPQARLDDGLLDLVVVPSMSTARALLSLPSLYRGTHLAIPGVLSRRVRSVRIESAEATPLLFDIEGEQVGATPATVTCLPGAIRICVPDGSDPATC